MIELYEPMKKQLLRDTYGYFYVYEYDRHMLQGDMRRRELDISQEDFNEIFNCENKQPNHSITVLSVKASDRTAKAPNRLISIVVSGDQLIQEDLEVNKLSGLYTRTGGPCRCNGRSLGLKNIRLPGGAIEKRRVLYWDETTPGGQTRSSIWISDGRFDKIKTSNLYDGGCNRL